MKVDLSEYERKIVQKGRLYLYCAGGDGSLQWTNSKYDAWSSKRRDKAVMVAKKVGGRVRTFNPITGDIH